jgi:hypothetical protein
MKIDTAKMQRILLLNNRFGEYIPRFVFRLLNTPRFGFRARNILYALKYLHSNILRGRVNFNNVAEFGVAQGEGFRQLVILTLSFCALRSIPAPEFHAFDTFEGLPESNDPSDVGTWDKGDYPGDLTKLQALLDKNGVGKFCHLHKGLFSETLPKMGLEFSPSLIMVDCDYYTSTKDIFENLKGSLASGTVVYFDDLGTNFYNKNMGEERFIHELNSGYFGNEYYLHNIYDKLYVWSNSTKPIMKSRSDVLHIHLKDDFVLDDFY